MGMTPADFKRVKELFQTALELAPPQRAAFLAENCHDEQTREQIERLLRNHQEVGSFLEDPVLSRLWGSDNTEETLDSKAGAALSTTAPSTQVVEPMTG